jgi:hypothetical protein
VSRYLGTAFSGILLGKAHDRLRRQETLQPRVDSIVLAARQLDVLEVDDKVLAYIIALRFPGLRHIKNHPVQYGEREVQQHRSDLPDPQRRAASHSDVRR